MRRECRQLHHNDIPKEQREREERYGKHGRLTSSVLEADGHGCGNSRNKQPRYRSCARRGNRRTSSFRCRGHKEDSLLLPWLWQVRMRRVGVCERRQGHPHRGRRLVLLYDGKPLLQGSGFNPGMLSPRPHQVSHEAHQPQGRGRPRLGSHLLGRGIPDHRGQLHANPRKVRPRVAL